MKIVYAAAALLAALALILTGCSAGTGDNPALRARIGDPHASASGQLVVVPAADVTPMITYSVHAQPGMPISVGWTSPDPGQRLYAWFAARGRRYQAGWPAIADVNRTGICREFASGYADRAPGAHDEYGVSAPIAMAGLAATDFCGPWMTLAADSLPVAQPY
jgi:hypothetical protein